MKGRKFFSKIAAALLVSGMTLTGLSLSALAEPIYNSDPVDGVIRNSSRIYRFQNIWAPGAPVEQSHGQEYTFRAEEGDNIRVVLDVDRRRGFSPILVVFHAETNKQIAYSQQTNFNFRVPRSGDYILVVLAKDLSSSMRYTLEVSGIDRNRNSSRRDRDRYNNGNGRTGRYGDREQFLEDEFGLRPVDCQSRRSMVRVTFDEDGDDATYCAQPTRSIPAGEYYYNSRTRDLESATSQDNRDRCRLSVGGVCINR